jgi:hypothetical protein
LPPTFEAVRRARVPAYLIASLMLLIPLLEIAINAWPPKIHDPGWRFGLIGLSAGVSTGTLLALLIIYFVGVFADERPAIWLVALVSALMVLIFVGASGAFVLDALQMRAQLEPSLQDRYNVQSGWVFAKICLAVLGAAVLSVSAFRAARSVRRNPDRGGVKAPSALLVTSSASVAPGQTP